MLYLHMRNYRGFYRALIPLRTCTFLVGENSTGKSSFLRVLQLVSSPDFWFFPRFDRGSDDEVQSFADLVSAAAGDKSFFEVGIVHTDKRKDGAFGIVVAVNRFAEREGMPFLASHFQIHGSRQTLISAEKQATKYWVGSSPAHFSTENEAVDFATSRIASVAQDAELKAFPKSVRGNPPLGICLSLVRALEAGEKPNLNEFKAEIPLSLNLTWIAPIRTRPRRIYEGFSRNYSAEGEHSPFVLKRSLKSRLFVDRLAAFGDASGLFETVVTHTFGKGERNPFEILVRLRGADLNINNVGYGVSQALPLVVEFLSREKERTFAVQQPEVHLHPRAQAALGGLLLELSKERKHSFVVETHSDYLIDRFRADLAACEDAPDSQVIFFERSDSGNLATPLPIHPNGQYPTDQPKAFREFFLNEEMRLLSL